MERDTRERILSLLLRDARRSLRSIAKELDISTTTASRIVKELEDEGIVLGYTAIVDWHKLGRDYTLCLQVTVNPKADIDKVGMALKRHGAVKQVFYTTGDATFSAYAVCADSGEASDVLDRLRSISGVERVVPHTVLKVY